MNKIFFYSFPVYRITQGINEGIKSFSLESAPKAVEALKNKFSATIFSAVTELQKKIKNARPLYNKNVLKHLDKLSDDIDEISTNFSRNINASMGRNKIISSYKSTREELIKKNNQINQVFFGGNMINQILLNNPDNKITSTPENSKFLVLNELVNKNVRTEAFMLLTIIEKYWNKEEAEKQYKLANKQAKFDIDRLRSFFSKENQSSLKVGFVYLHPIDPRIKRMLFFVRYEDGSLKAFLKPLPEILERLKLIAKGKNVEYTLPDLERAKIEADSIDKKETKLDLFRQLKAQNLFTNKWQPLPDSLIGGMSSLYGRGCGNYLYRYIPEKNTILMVRIQNGLLKEDSRHFGGEIYLGNTSHPTYGKWQSYDKANTIKMLNYYLVKPEIQKQIAESQKRNQNNKG
jgi:hypothetical protein